MHDFLAMDVSDRWSCEDVDVRQFARQVVNVLAARGSGDDVGVKEPFLSDLIAAAIDPDPDSLRAVIADMRRVRISSAAIADRYIPAAARRMGEDWVNDRMGFAQVAIGCARLQGMLRDIGESWAADDSRSGDRAIVLMAVPEGDDHMLGAVVATGWLRRAGISVCLKLQARATELTDLIAKRGFDAVLISAANTEKLDALTKVVSVLRSTGGSKLPIFVGGAVLNGHPDVASVTGADHATSDLEFVARKLGVDVAKDRQSTRA